MANCELRTVDTLAFTDWENRISMSMSIMMSKNTSIRRSGRAIAKKNPQLSKLEVLPGKPLTVSSIILK